MAANEYGPYYLLLATGGVQLVIAIYLRYVRRRDKKRDDELVAKSRLDLEWKKKTDWQVEELRELMRVVRYHLRERFGVDIKLDR